MKGGVIISGLPKLSIKLFGHVNQEICELEQAKSRLSFDGWAVTVEGKKVRSYDELYQLASQEKFRDKEFLQVVVLNRMIGG